MAENCGVPAKMIFKGYRIIFSFNEATMVSAIYAHYQGEVLTVCHTLELCYTGGAVLHGAFSVALFMLYSDISVLTVISASGTIPL